MWDEVPFYKNGTEWKSQTALYVQIKDSKNVKQVEKLISSYSKDHNNAVKDFVVTKYKLSKFDEAAIRDRLEKIHPLFTPAPHLGLFFGALTIGILIFLICCFNWINSTVVSSASKVRSIAIRKILGSQVRNSVTQVFTQNLLLVISSAFLGMFLAIYLLIPFY